MINGGITAPVARTTPNSTMLTLKNRNDHAEIRFRCSAITSADAVSFRVNVRGDPAALAEAISRDGRLLPVDAGRLIYALSP